MDDRSEEILETTGDGDSVEEQESAADRAVRLATELEESRREVKEIQARCAGLERRREIEAALVELGAVDVETARLLVESRLEKDGEKGVGEVVAAVRERKPFLFQPPATASGVMSAQGEGGGANRVMARAAVVARESGHRRDVLRFMRLRRKR